MTCLIDLAHLTVGISTPHYLYLNEATQALVESGSAEAASAVLDRIDENREAIAKCSLPARESPEELLLHLSQSNAYHRQLAADARLATKVFCVYHEISGVPFHERLAVDPSPALQSRLYDPAAYNPVRGVAALWSTMESMNAWSKIPASKNSFENVMDLFQSPMHVLVGGLMTYFSLIEQMSNGCLPRGAALDWFRLMEDGVLYMIRHSTEFVGAMVHDLWSGAAIAAASAKPEPMSVMDGKEVGQVLTVLSGIDQGLTVLSEALLSRNGIAAIRTGTLAREAREKHTTPLIKRFLEIGGTPTPGIGRAPHGREN